MYYIRQRLDYDIFDAINKLKEEHCDVPLTLIKLNHISCDIFLSDCLQLTFKKVNNGIDLQNDIENMWGLLIINEPMIEEIQDIISYIYKCRDYLCKYFDGDYQLFLMLDVKKDKRREDIKIMRNMINVAEMKIYNFNKRLKEE